MQTPGVLDIPSMKGQCSEAEWQARVDNVARGEVVDEAALTEALPA